MEASQGGEEARVTGEEAGRVEEKDDLMQKTRESRDGTEPGNSIWYLGCERERESMF